VKISLNEKQIRLLQLALDYVQGDVEEVLGQTEFDEAYLMKLQEHLVIQANRHYAKRKGAQNG
jgi:hypothetical protein